MEMLEAVMNFIPFESLKSASVLSWPTIKGWGTRVELVIRAT
jgi:hypothetical protein